MGRDLTYKNEIYNCKRWERKNGKIWVLGYHVAWHSAIRRQVVRGAKTQPEGNRQVLKVKK